MSELAKRWAVAGVGVPVVIVLLRFGGWWLAVPLSALAALGALEVYRLARGSETRPFTVLGAVVAGGLVLVTTWRPSFSEAAPPLLAIGVALGLVALVGSVFMRSAHGAPLESVAVTCFGALYAGVPMASVPLLHALPEVAGWSGGPKHAWGGLLVVALPLACAWIGDATAYFVGSAVGRAKLAPTISPKKTWAGAWAGLGGATAAALLWYGVASPRLPALPFPGWTAAAGVGVLLGVAAQVGDLSESLLKRQAGVKDSGALFPGHGGVLDRLDALVLVLPLAYAAFVVVEALG